MVMNITEDATDGGIASYDINFASDVPEPGSLAFVGAGLVLLVCRSRIQRDSKA